jgi:hypothetical protein
LPPEPLDNLRLTLMQQVLPMGLALAERARKGGPAEVAAAFDGRSSDPLDALRQEGEPAASRLRAQLDQLSPGLGNPVMPVQVREVDPDQGQDQDQAWDPDPAALPERLRQIGERLEALEQRLQAGA